MRNLTRPEWDIVRPKELQKPRKEKDNEKRDKNPKDSDNN